MNKTADVVVIGAGIIGASIGYHLIAADPSLNVVMLEAAPYPGTGATSKATGGIRHQFGTSQNIQLSLLSRPYLLNFKERFDVDPMSSWHGYMFLTDQQGHWEALQRQVALQNSLDVPTQLLNSDDVRKIFPTLQVDELVGATFCAWDGSVDSHSILQGFMTSYRAAGGKLVTDAPVIALTRGASTWTVETPADLWECGAVVIAAGPHSREVAAFADVDVPAYPYRRQAFVLESHPDVPSEIPLTVDMDTGWYIHAGIHDLLVGGTDKDNAPGMEDLSVDWTLFEDVYAATLRRLPSLDDAQIRHGYVGVRTLTPDHHPILGPVPAVPGLFLACGSSGHGIMHSPAVGLLLSEWVLQGSPQSWDASELTIDRFEQQKLIHESAVF